MHTHALDDSDGSLVDSYKHLNVNRMAAGSRLPLSSHEIFSHFNFLSTPYTTFKQSIGPGASF